MLFYETYSLLQHADSTWADNLGMLGHAQGCMKGCIFDFFGPFSIPNNLCFFFVINGREKRSVLSLDVSSKDKFLDLRNKNVAHFKAVFPELILLNLIRN